MVEIQHANPYYDDSYAVNSENLGPYGDAIQYELIPEIERRFRGIGQGWARFTYGGSTGGWEALAVQVLYPEEWNGAWAACPDPIDFRAYVTTNIYEDRNAYWAEGPFGRVERPGHRNWLGHVSATIRDTAAKGIGIIAMKTQAGGYSVAEGSLSPHQAALAWVLENPGVATTIPSMVSFSQVDENVKASGKRLGWGGKKALDQYARAIGDRHCGLCGECAGSCPNGVDVPSVLRCLTYLEGYRQADLARGSYRGIPSPGNAGPCAACAECAVSCRLGLDVQRLARRAHRHLA